MLFRATLNTFGFIEMPWLDILTDLAVFSVLAYFVSRGHYWAFIAVIALQGAELFAVKEISGIWSSAVIWSSVIPYVMCLRALYKAHSVEQVYRRKKKSYKYCIFYACKATFAIILE